VPFLLLLVTNLTISDWKFEIFCFYAFITIYAPMIYIAPWVMFFMRARTLQGGGGLPRAVLSRVFKVQNFKNMC